METKTINLHVYQNPITHKLYLAPTDIDSQTRYDAGGDIFVMGPGRPWVKGGRICP